MAEICEIPVRHAVDGETTLVFEDVDRITVHGSSMDDQLVLALRGHRDGDIVQIENGILDVLEDGDEVIANEVPRTEDGTSAPLAALLGGN